MRENSAAAFQHALDAGIETLELDVRRSRDGALIVLHDERVRIDGKRRRIGSLTLAELRQAMPWLLEFREYLERFGSLAPFNLDLKEPGYEPQVAAELRRFGLGPTVLVSSGHIRSLRRMAELIPAATIGLSRGHLASGVPWRLPRDILTGWERLTMPPLILASAPFARADATMLQHHVITQTIVRLLNHFGYQVYAWTVDDPAEAVRLAECGVAGIASNHPWEILDAIGRVR